MRIYVVRHPLTQLNVEGKVQGWIDSPLTAEGVEKCHATGKLLKDKGIQKIYSSDLGRCKQTVQIINSYLHVPVEYTEDLREQNCGEIEGKLRELFKPYSENPAETIPGGESQYDVQRRVMHCINGLHAQACLVVTHGTPTAAILSAAYGVPPNDARCRPQHPTLITINKDKTLEVASIE